jgi:hypothetical protein
VNRLIEYQFLGPFGLDLKTAKRGFGSGSAVFRGFLASGSKVLMGCGWVRRSPCFQ